MESSQNKTLRNKIPALALTLLALIVLIWVIWRIDSAPSTNDAYASADTIDVVPEVSGRIIELAVHDNQQVKQGDLLFRIDPRPYEANLAKAEASLAGLDKQIMLVGQLNKFEIWSETRWLQQVDEDIQALPDMDWTTSDKLRDFSL